MKTVRKTSIYLITSTIIILLALFLILFALPTESLAEASTVEDEISWKEVEEYLYGVFGKEISYVDGLHNLDETEPIISYCTN